MLMTILAWRCSALVMGDAWRTPRRAPSRVVMHVDLTG